MDLITKFQSTLPRGERRQTSRRRPQQSNFNPRSHEGSDVQNYLLEVAQSISIHAPTRGATRVESAAGGMSSISIHAPTRGATLLPSLASRILDISIHAPTRGATSKNLMRFGSWQKFQSTLPRGERQRLDKIKINKCNFNPRSHEGSDYQP